MPVTTTFSPVARIMHVEGTSAMTTRRISLAILAMAIIAGGCFIEPPVGGRSARSPQPDSSPAPAALPAAFAVGRPCPSFTFQTIDGGKFSLQGAKGKDLIVFVGSYT
jgi:hypothetical protein